MEDGVLFRGGSTKEDPENWDKNSLYHALPLGKKAIGDSAYANMPDKVTVSLKQHSKPVRTFINKVKAREENLHI